MAPHFPHLGPEITPNGPRRHRRPNGAASASRDRVRAGRPGRNPRWAAGRRNIAVARADILLREGDPVRPAVTASADVK
jgi:hypothetical protein